VVQSGEKNKSITLGGVTVEPGNRQYIDLPLPPLYTHTSVSMPVHVISGRKAGPILFVSAAIHGDEINGIEIIRRLLGVKSLNKLAGTLVAVPVVNVYGFVSQSRYLPDRRDLNRSFPGSDRGTMAARLAETFMTEIVDKCTHGIDFHTATAGRDNLPQVRADLDACEELLPMAMAFAPPVILDSQTRSGTLRAAVGKKPCLLYEAGEALRFNDLAIRAGVNGTMRVMRYLNMLPATKKTERKYEPTIANDSIWMRAPQSGIVRSHLQLGDVVAEGDSLGVVSDPFGELEEEVITRVSGVLVGQTTMPLVHEGEALFHVACLSSTKSAARVLDEFHLEYEQSLVHPV